jgi:hypothetical protein
MGNTWWSLYIWMNPFYLVTRVETDQRFFVSQKALKIQKTSRMLFVSCVLTVSLNYFIIKKSKKDSWWREGRDLLCLGLGYLLGNIFSDIFTIQEISQRGSEEQFREVLRDLDFEETLEALPPVDPYGIPVVVSRTGIQTVTI